MGRWPFRDSTARLSWASTTTGTFIKTQPAGPLRGRPACEMVRRAKFLTGVSAETGRSGSQPRPYDAVLTHRLLSEANADKGVVFSVWSRTASTASWYVRGRISRAEVGAVRPQPVTETVSPDMRVTVSPLYQRLIQKHHNSPRNG